MVFRAVFLWSSVQATSIVRWAKGEVSTVSCPKRKADQELPSLICAEIEIGSTSVFVCDRSDDSESLKAVRDRGIFQLEMEKAIRSPANINQSPQEMRKEKIEEHKIRTPLQECSDKSNWANKQEWILKM